MTPRRAVDGPITPQHYVDFERPDLDLDLAQRIFAQLEPDTALLLGGLGDAMLHPQFEQIVGAAAEAQVLGIGIETDLLCEPELLEILLDLPLDLVSVRFNADQSQTYEKVMGTDAFSRVARNLRWLHHERRQRDQVLPWIVPRLIKTPDTLKDMESFFERWKRAQAHPVIEPAGSG